MGLIYESNFPDVCLSHSIDRHPEQKSFSMHLHGNMEMYVFVSGKARYHVEGNEYELSSGNLLIMRQNESHFTNFLEDCPYERYVLNFSPSVLDAIDPEHRLLAPFNDRPLGSDNLYRPSDINGVSALSCIKAMCINSTDPYAKRLAIISNLLPLLQGVCDSFNKRKTPELQSTVAGQITAYINEHLFEKLTVESIANHFFLSVSQVERIFKKATHASVWQYVNAKRLAAARVKIESGISAYTACEECAFGDYSSFYRAYIKAYGEGPGTFKKIK